MSSLALWNRIDPEPFRRWCNQCLEHEEISVEDLAHRLGLDERRLHHWRTAVEYLDRVDVDEALFNADVLMWEVYEESAEELEVAAVESERLAWASPKAIAEPIAKSCEECSGAFETTVAHKRFCGPVCQRTFGRRRRRHQSLVAA